MNCFISILVIIVFMLTPGPRLGALAGPKFKHNLRSLRLRPQPPFLVAKSFVFWLPYPEFFRRTGRSKFTAADFWM